MCHSEARFLREEPALLLSSDTGFYVIVGLIRVIAEGSG